MSNPNEQKLVKSLEEILSLYNIKLDPNAITTNNSGAPVDYVEVIAQTQDKLDELNEQAEDVYKATGMTKEELEAYSNNPNNFTKEQWEMLQKVRAECEEFKRKAHGIIGEEALKIAKPETTRKKQKQKFSQKKDWLRL